MYVKMSTCVFRVEGYWASQPLAQTGASRPVALGQQEGLYHLLRGLGARVDVLKRVRYRKLPVP